MQSWWRMYLYKWPSLRIWPWLFALECIYKDFGDSDHGQVIAKQNFKKHCSFDYCCFMHISFSWFLPNLTSMELNLFDYSIPRHLKTNKCCAAVRTHIYKLEIRFCLINAIHKLSIFKIYDIKTNFIKTSFHKKRLHLKGFY